MNATPILFSGPMVCALLEGRKTQTRRVVKPRRRWASQYPVLDAIACAASHAAWWWDGIHSRAGVMQECPYGEPGDLLWVREAHAIVGSVDPGWVLYRANGYQSECARHGFTKPYPPESEIRWKPSIHMPRWASRLTLRITDVRVQRLQDISEADAKAEGTPRYSPAPVSVDDFRQLWNSINGPDSWTANTWVWALTFEVIESNVEKVQR